MKTLLITLTLALTFNPSLLLAQTTSTVPITTQTAQSSKLYKVVRVVDGDTIDVMISGKKERIRLIGVNTPETVDPRKPVECFGKEASNKAKSLLTGKKVFLEKDDTQGDKDKYGRLLRYVLLSNGTNVNLSMIKDGYAYEYTYDLPYKYQVEFKSAQKQASDQKKGLWGSTCQNTASGTLKTVVPTAIVATPVAQATVPAPTSSCTIKGNISTNAKKEKIYHVQGCRSYNATIIDESEGEKWFCSEQDAIQAGWRKALNC